MPRRCHGASLVVLLAGLVLGGCGGGGGGQDPGQALVSFGLVADMREFAPPLYPGPAFFEGTCAAMARHNPLDFVVSPGDLDPPAPVLATLRAQVGESLPWYPVAGNHETETVEDMVWLREWNPSGTTLPNVVRVGPVGSEETTYALQWGPLHLVVLNEYWDGASDVGTDGDVVDPLYDWLAEDLASDVSPFVVVVGHEPIVPQPDMDTGRLRHVGDSLDAHLDRAERFRALLVARGVAAYVCGHTHGCSFADLGGVWQIDVGHARGEGDTGAPTTYLVARVYGETMVVEAWRLLAGGWTLRRSLSLSPRP